MREIQRIVVPLDFGKNTDMLVDYALLLSHRLSATIHFVHVVYVYEGDAMLGNVYAKDIIERIVKHAQRELSKILERATKMIPGCTGTVLEGDPVDEIVATATAQNSDLIIISTHGAKGLEKILLGSVAERVLKRAHCPVLIMNPYKM